MCTSMVRLDISCDIACVLQLKKLYNYLYLKLFCAKCQFYLLQFSVCTLLSDVHNISNKPLEI